MKIEWCYAILRGVENTLSKKKQSTTEQRKAPVLLKAATEQKASQELQVKVNILTDVKTKE